MDIELEKKENHSETRTIGVSKQIVRSENAGGFSLASGPFGILPTRKLQKPFDLCYEVIVQPPTAVVSTKGSRPL